MAKMDAELERLFKLPLSDFTAERNALAKRAGGDGAAIKQLSKPPIAAWAVNQLFYQDRERYDALIDAATELRRTHKAVLEGRKGDLRGAGREHDLAVDAALKSTIALLKAAGHPVTDATRQTIINTLRALPADEPPGRLTRTLAPGGFEMLAGITLRPGAKPAPLRLAKRTARPSPAQDREAERETSRERERRAAAERAVRDADQRAKQAEFEAARAAREVAKAGARVDAARRAVDEAQTELAAAEQAATISARARETADRRVRDAQAALEKARAALDRV